MLPVLVFDLDDTLYPELTYVHSGFGAVATRLAVRTGLSAATLTAEMVAVEARLGRGRVFDEVLRQHQLYAPGVVGECLRTYRQHLPQLQLYPDAERCLTRFANHPLYLVTDGHKGVQTRKVAALDLAARVRHAYITNRYGAHRAKPSPYCFELICRREKTAPPHVLYVGDNPNKDFVGIRPLGFRTVRILRGNYAHLPAAATHAADREIHSLDELTDDFLAELFA